MTTSGFPEIESRRIELLQKINETATVEDLEFFIELMMTQQKENKPKKPRFRPES